MIGTPYTLTEIARIVEADTFDIQHEAETIREISFDSRQIYAPEETLFLALKTDQEDGHNYLRHAAEKGVKNFLVSDLTLLPYGCNYLLVEDTLKALQTLASFHRDRFQPKIIALAGSNGKTIVKEWLSTLLEDRYRVVKSPRSYNSQLGVPLSLLQINENHELALIEAGISRPAEMGRLRDMIRPDWGIMTHFGDAHDEGFATRKEKLQEKLSLFQGVREVIVTADDPFVQEELSSGTFEITSIGKAAEAEIKLVSSSETNEGWEFTLEEGGRRTSYRLLVSGPAALENALLLIATARKLGLKEDEIRAGLSRLYPISMRTQIISDNPEITILNDACNADLASIQNAFLLLQGSTSQPGKTLILSDLEHQGQQKAHLQEKILEDAIQKFGRDQIILIGPEFCRIAPPEIRAFPDTESFLNDFDYQQFRRSVVLLKGARKFELERIIPYLSMQVNATLFRINLSKLVGNLRYFRRQLPPETKMMVMVKAFSYGTGTWEIAQVLEREKVEYLAVAYLSEGIHLRNRKIKSPIMVMNPDENGLDQLYRFQLEPEIYSMSYLERYVAIGKKLGASRFPVHIKIDTGMHRLGFTQSHLPELIDFLRKHPGVEVLSLMSHLAAADDPEEDEYTESQVRHFTEFAYELSGALSIQPMRHILNTAGILRFSRYGFDMVRLGLGLYGLCPVMGMEVPELQEIGSLVTVISQIHDYSEGVSVGYGRSQFTDRPSRIATLPVGYADGIPRLLSKGKISFLVRGQFAPVFGRVCMDMLMIDITDIPEAKEGDEVVLFGQQNGKFQSVNSLAKAAGTISYEILTGISKRVRRVYGME